MTERLVFDAQLADRREAILEKVQDLMLEATVVTEGLLGESDSKLIRHEEKDYIRFDGPAIVLPARHFTKMSEVRRCVAWPSLFYGRHAVVPSSDTSVPVPTLFRLNWRAKTEKYKGERNYTPEEMALSHGRTARVLGNLDWYFIMESAITFPTPRRGELFDDFTELAMYPVEALTPDYIARYDRYAQRFENELETFEDAIPNLDLNPRP